MTTTSTELVTLHNDSMSEKVEWAKTLAVATLLPKAFQKNPGNVLYAVEYADALDIPRINAITSIHVIEGKPSASADLIAGLVRRAGHTLRIYGDDASAHAELIRCDDREFTYAAHWDMDKARAAGLANKDVWKKYPAAMLRSRAITEVARMGASEALLGLIYTPEELGADVDQTGAPVRYSATATVQPASGADRMKGILHPDPPQNTEEAGEADGVAAGHQATQATDPASSPAPVDLGDAPEAITPAQLKLVHIELNRIGKGQEADRAWALNFYDQTIGHPVESSKELSKAEASDVIEALKAIGDTELMGDPWDDADATGSLPINTEQAP